VARVLIVGCGCRGQALASALVAAGHAVRGTTRDPSRGEAIEAAGAEAAVADPDRLATLTPHVGGISALCWLLGTAEGEPELVAALHGPRLESMLETLVDTPVRGVVYEGAGTVAPGLLAHGAQTVLGKGATYRMPVEVVHRDPGEPRAWLEAMVEAVEGVLAA
jgi:uncharacterized protein YbjT (DUF2867 family)